MEEKDWNNRTRQRGDSNRYRRNEPYVDENTYRGAYRLDNKSEDRNISTWDSNWSEHRNQGNKPDYNRDYNRNYNSDYNRNYNRDSRHSEPDHYQRDWRNSQSQNIGKYDSDNYNLDSRYRDTDRSYRTGNTSDWNRYDDRDRDRGHYNFSSVRSRIDSPDHDRGIGGNFQADYGPDHYGRGGGENYGNMAGSLSYGYDGTSNYDPDWDRRYDPLTGHRRSYHGNYTSRHPEPKMNYSDESYQDYKNRYY